MALTQIDDRGLKTPIDLIDNEKIRLGTGNDLELYHDASNSFTINNTGNYLIKSAGDVYLRTATNEDAVACIANGAVELYYDNVRKFRTTAEGAIVDGSLYLADNKHLILNDTNRAKFGNGEDLQIYHDGSKSVIQNSTGQLNIAGADIRITNAAQTESQIIATENGAVELYHNNVKKFETYSGGCIFQGNIKADQDNATLILGAGSDLQLWHDGTNNIIYSDAPDLYIKTTSSEICARFGRNGGVDLYYDNSKKLSTTSTGVKIESSSNTTLHLTSSTSSSASIEFGDTDDDDEAEIWYDNYSKKLNFRTTEASDLVFYRNGTEKTRITSDGLTFNGDTASANALSDYEEGTHTVTDSSSNSITLTNETTGRYTKIGRFVNFQFDISVGSNSNTNAAQVSLPFQNDVHSYGGGQAGWTDLDRPAFGHISDNDGCWLMDNNSSGSGKHLSWQDCSGKRFIMQVTYMTT